MIKEGNWTRDIVYFGLRNSGTLECLGVIIIINSNYF